MSLEIDPTCIQKMLLEDAPFGDPTGNLIPDGCKQEAYVLAKEDGIICGTDFIKAVFKLLDPAIEIGIYCCDGEEIQKNKIIATIKGNIRSLLRGERIALNLISYLSGIATETNRFVKIAEPYGVKILDTRKTLPLYRAWVKYAVKTGGGCNHRFSLSDLYMIKDNHIEALGGIDPAFETLQLHNKSPFLKIEVEVKSLKEALKALKYSPDIIMLDNFTPKEAEEAMYYLKDKAILEISGGINITNLEAYAKLKPDYISVGSLTHHVNALDMSMKIKPEEKNEI